MAHVVRLDPLGTAPTQRAARAGRPRRDIGLAGADVTVLLALRYAPRLPNIGKSCGKPSRR
jgi:hypothetical protein